MCFDVSVSYEACVLCVQVVRCDLHSACGTALNFTTPGLFSLPTVSLHDNRQRTGSFPLDRSISSSRSGGVRSSAPSWTCGKGQVREESTFSGFTSCPITRIRTRRFSFFSVSHSALQVFEGLRVKRIRAMLRENEADKRDASLWLFRVMFG